MLSNDEDTDGTLDVDSVVIAAPATGTAVVVSDGTKEGTTIDYTHDGSGAVGDAVTFSYTVADDEGLVSSDTAVTVTLLAVPNTAPVTLVDNASVEIGGTVSIAVPVSYTHLTLPTILLV